jgi:hypothetical protein
MPSKQRREVTLLDDVTGEKLDALSKQSNLPIARLLRMSIKQSMSSPANIKSLIAFGDPIPEPIKKKKK